MPRTESWATLGRSSRKLKGRGNSALAQQLAVFLLKRAAALALWLCRDELQHGINPEEFFAIF
jgi:hypothetical protein